jgi:hypothetical protein
MKDTNPDFLVKVGALWVIFATVMAFANAVQHGFHLIPQTEVEALNDICAAIFLSFGALFIGIGKKRK